LRVDWVEIIGKKKVYYKDRNRNVWVICEDSQENRKFFSAYKRKLERRFRQRAIFMFFTGNVSIVY
jgi:hypothetical protein